MPPCFDKRSVTLVFYSDIHNIGQYKPLDESQMLSHMDVLVQTVLDRNFAFNPNNKDLERKQTLKDIERLWNLLIFSIIGYLWRHGKQYWRATFCHSWCSQSYHNIQGHMWNDFRGIMCPQEQKIVPLVLGNSRLRWCSATVHGSNFAKWFLECIEIY